MRTFAARLDFEVRNKPILAVLLLVLIVTVLYAPVSGHGFLDFDDNEYVTDNPHVLAGLSVPSIVWAFTDTTTFYWHPVTWLSHMLDCQLFGVNPRPHHLENLFLHALNAAILFILLRKATGSLWRSLGVSGLFALHPLAVETVAWVAERKSLLSTFFSLLTIAAYGWYVERRGPRRYAVLVGLFLLALMSKAMAVTIPLLLLLIDYWPLQRVQDPRDWSKWRQLIVEKVPLFLLSACSAAITVIGQRSANSIVRNVPIGVRLEQVLTSYTVYLRKLIYPADLAAFYPYHLHWLSIGQVVASLAILLGISILALRKQTPRFVAFGWFFYVVALLPVAGWVPNGRVVIADRFTYIPAIGLFIALVWTAGELTRNSVQARTACAVVFGAVLGLLALQTSTQISYWQNEMTLFSRAAAVQKAPDAFIEVKLGQSLLAAGRIDDALHHYVRSCELEPGFDVCHFNIAEILFSRYDAQTALREYLLAAQYTSNPVIAQACLVNSGEAMMQLGDFQGAERQLSIALSRDPSDQNAARLMRTLRSRQGR